MQQRYIVKSNIRHFERLLQADSNGPRRIVLERLLTEAKNELSALEGIWSWTCPHLDIPASFGAVAEEILDRIVAEVGATYGSMQLWDEKYSCLRLIAHCNFDQSFARQFSTIRNGDGTICAAALSTRAPVMVEDIEAADAFASLRSWTRKNNIRAIQTTPVLTQSGALIGVFSTHYIQARTFTLKDQQLNARYAAEISSAFARMAP